MHAIMHQDGVLGKAKGTPMTTHAVTLKLPEHIYLRLQRIALATQQPFDAVVLRAIQVGAPPSWEDAPAEFQADLAALDRLDDDALWHIARRRQTTAEMVRYQELLEKNANNTLSDAERTELTQLRTAADRFMLQKVQAAALLRWRGHHIPPADKL
jgi:predicted transcriptional regulator